MLCKCYWIVLYIVHFTAFCLGGPFFSDTKGAWQFCETPFSCSVTNETFVAELFLTNGVSVNLFGF